MPAAMGEVQLAVPPAVVTLAVTVYSGEKEPVTVQFSSIGDEVVYGELPDGPPHPLLVKDEKT
jgi:hypothetical protein